jgi:hypothetical protein
VASTDGGALHCSGGGGLTGMAGSGILLGWSSAQAAEYYSDSSSEEDEFQPDQLWDQTNLPNEEDESFSDDECEEVGRKRFSNEDIISMLQENGGNVDVTILKMLQELTQDSLEHMSSQGEAITNRKVKNTKKRLKDLCIRRKKMSSTKRSENLNDTFEKASQNSFVESVKKEKVDASDESEAEEEIEKDPATKTKFRKPLDQLKNQEDVLERTKDIFHDVKAEAEHQITSPTKLLALLMYRENYVKNRPLATKMLQIFRGNCSPFQKMTAEKCHHLYVRRRLGKGAYAATRRLLKPEGIQLRDERYLL